LSVNRVVDDEYIPDDTYAGMPDPSEDISRGRLEAWSIARHDFIAFAAALRRWTVD
jgi:hypothetical protein